MMQTEDVHTRINTQQVKRNSQEIKEVLKHTTDGYIVWATLRAKATKELPPKSLDLY
jgi:hypothetical protein